MYFSYKNARRSGTSFIRRNKFIVRSWVSSMQKEEKTNVRLKMRMTTHSVFQISVSVVFFSVVNWRKVLFVVTIVQFTNVASHSIRNQNHQMLAAAESTCFKQCHFSFREFCRFVAYLQATQILNDVWCSLGSKTRHFESSHSSA